MAILELGHLNSIGICLDVGHAHIVSGIQEAISVLGPRVGSVHVHDNHMVRDEHLWPGEGTIDWTATMQSLKALPSQPACVLEIQATPADTHPGIQDKIQAAFDLLQI